jgi:predicted outer membrane repeat protein
VFVESSAKLFINQSTFQNCTSSRNGGAVYVGMHGQLQFQAFNFSDNFALLNGGAIFSENGSSV